MHGQPQRGCTLFRASGTPLEQAVLRRPGDLPLGGPGRHQQAQLQWHQHRRRRQLAAALLDGAGRRGRLSARAQAARRGRRHGLAGPGARPGIRVLHAARMCGRALGSCAGCSRAAPVLPLSLHADVRSTPHASVRMEVVTGAQASEFSRVTKGTMRPVARSNPHVGCPRVRRASRGGALWCPRTTTAG